LTLQMMFRMYHKRYDVDPLTMPEFQLGFNEEDDQDLLSGRTTWDAGGNWDVSFAFSRMRTESAIPARYYIKHVFLLQIQHKF
jgi:hypothetical protein